VRDQRVVGGRGLAVFACSGGGPGGEADIGAKVISLEKRLTTSCACHPRKIEGLPIQAAIRADLRAWITEGKDDREILWLGFRRYGSELLAAGIADLEGRVRLAAWVAAFITLMSFTLLVLHLRRRGSA
ncbi:MAG: hypothetical protein ACE5FC_11695, partial [Myxococcota bacterium]